MNTAEILNLLENYKPGTYKPVSWSRIIKLKDGTEIIKHARTIARFGINYGHLTNVLEKAKMKNSELNIKHADWVINKYVKKTSTGKEVLCVFSTNKHKIYTYYTDKKGNKLNKEAFADKLYAADRRASDIADMYYVNLSDLKSFII